MKFCFGVSLCFAASIGLAANAPNFGNDFPKFQTASDVPITWAAKNSTPTNLWIYKVIPQTFPAKPISELLRQSPFTNRITGTISNNFSLGNQTCIFHVNPAQGSVTYWNEYAPANHWDKTNHLWELVKGLPSQSETEKLGLKFLKQFGIQQKDLAQKADGHLITFGETKTRSYFDRRTQTNIENEVTARGVFFVRRLDGVDFTGIGVRGGCEIEYGNNKKISNFTLVWRNLERYEDYRTATGSEIMQFIRDGKAVITPKNPVNPSDLKSITVTEIIPRYMGADADEKQTFVFPFAQVGAHVNLGNTNADIELFCPILSTNKVGQ
jgi:hypothetical protein